LLSSVYLKKTLRSSTARKNFRILRSLAVYVTMIAAVGPVGGLGIAPKASHLSDVCSTTELPALFAALRSPHPFASALLPEGGFEPPANRFSIYYSAAELLGCLGAGYRDRKETARTAIKTTSRVVAA
jgi:hypothetical protein